MLYRAATLALVVVTACGSDAPPTQRPIEFGGPDRPVNLKPPTTFKEGQTYPLVLVLHGYGASGIIQAAFFETIEITDRAFVLAPDGLTDSTGHEFWNADAACCDFDNTHVDDSGYLAKLLTDVAAAWPVDQVFVEGHSNGGYMAYRMACDHADQISAIVSLAGDAASTPSACTPSQPVSVLHLHGTLDTIVPFDGAQQSTDQWAVHDGCGTTRASSGAAQDLDASIPGAETTREAFAGCPSGITVEQWTMTGTGHIPAFTPDVGTTLFDWLDAHRRP